MKKKYGHLRAMDSMREKRVARSSFQWEVIYI